MASRYERKQKFIFWLGIIILVFFALFLMTRAKVGYIYNDEPFILTLAHRFLKGDLILWDEWHPSQMVGYLNLPFTALYFLIHPNAEEMILHFRYIFIVLWLLTLLIVYRRISEFTNKIILTCMACSYLLLFSSMDIMTLSYNFYSLAGLMLCITFVITGKKKWEYFLAGIFYSVATLASPYLSIVFVIYYVIFGVIKFILKKELPNKVIEVTKYVLFGVLLSVILFFGFFFIHGGTLSKLITSLKYIFSDEAYPTRPIYQIIRGYLGTAFITFYYFAIIFVVSFFVPIIFRKSKELGLQLHCILFVVLLPWMVWHYHYITVFNKQMVQICFLGFHALIINRNFNKNFAIVYGIGLLFSIVLYCTSDLQVVATSMGLAISGFASFFLIEDSLKNTKWNEFLILTVCIAQLSSQIFLRIRKYYFDWYTPNDTYEITDSVAKGLYVTKEQYEEYYSIYNDIKDNIPENANLCSISQKPWVYFIKNSNYYTFSAWMSDTVDYKINRLKEYYSLHEEKMPNYVYIMKKDYSDEYVNEIFLGYEVIKCENAYILRKN